MKHHPLAAMALWVCAAAGCAASKPPPTPVPKTVPAPAPGSIEEYLPLADNTVLAYDSADEDTGERGTIVLQISRPRPGLVELNDGGSVTRLEFGADGVRYATGGYWLKGPLSLGSCWDGRSGKTCITQITRSVTVPAGQYQGCLETIEDTSAGNRVTTVFCPRVGMTTLRVESKTGQAVQVTLRSHGPKVDLDHLPPSLAGPNLEPGQSNDESAPESSPPEPQR